MDDKTQIGVLMEQGRWLTNEVSEIKSDVKLLLAFRVRMTVYVSLAAFIGASITTFIIEYVAIGKG